MPTSALNDCAVMAFTRELEERSELRSTILTPTVERHLLTLRHYHRARLEVVLLADLSDTENVLDLGTEYGLLAKLARNHTKGHVYGLDCDLNKLKVAIAFHRLPFPNLHFTHGDAIKMMNPDTEQPLVFPVKFDVVLVSRILHEMSQSRREAMFKHLKPYLTRDVRFVIDWSHPNEPAALAGASMLYRGPSDLHEGRIIHFRWENQVHAATCVAQLHTLIGRCQLEPHSHFSAHTSLGQDDSIHPWIDVGSDIPPPFLARLDELRAAHNNTHIPESIRYAINVVLDLDLVLRRPLRPTTISQYVASLINPVHRVADTLDPMLGSGEKWSRFLNQYYLPVFVYLCALQQDGTLSRENSCDMITKPYRAVGVFQYSRHPDLSTA